MAYEITFTYQHPTLQVTSIRSVSARPLPSLPLGIPPPAHALEIVRPATASAPAQVLYRRPFARLGHAEAYGPSSEWAPLPTGRRQVLVSLVPEFEPLQDSEPPYDLVVSSDGPAPLRLRRPLLPVWPPPPAPLGSGIVAGLTLIHGNVQEYGKRFNLVLVAEGYRAPDQARFEVDAAEVWQSIRTAAPFQDHLGAINVFRLDVWSPEAGADRGNAPRVHTSFGAEFPGTFPGSSSPPQLLVVNDEAVLATVRQQFEEQASLPHKIIVLVNTEFHGGSGGAGDGIAVASRHLGDRVRDRTVLHELGHTFGLVDEYPAGGGWGPNLSHLPDLDALPWKDLLIPPGPPPPIPPMPLPPLPTVRSAGGAPISFDTVGAFEDPDLPGWYRAQWLCRMRYSRHDDFCKVCSSHIEGALETSP